MGVPDLREYVSAGSHGLAFLASIPAAAYLWRRCGPDPARRLSAAVYGFGLASCFAASAACHATAAMGEPSLALIRLDHIAIFLLIAGTYTPIARHLMPVRAGAIALTLAWLGAAVWLCLITTLGPLPAPVATSMYLAMGWEAPCATWGWPPG